MSNQGGSRLAKDCLVIYFRGHPYLVKREQASRNFRKYIRGKLSDCKVVAGGVAIEAADIEFLIRSEVERINKDGRRVGKAIIERR